MFERDHHQRIGKALEAVDATFLADAKCYFGGGTASALLIGEYRESLDIDFLCADQEGYRKLRSAVFDKGLDAIFPNGMEAVRELRADAYGVRAVINVDGTPIKLEIVREARIDLAGEHVPSLPVMCLDRTSLFAEKLLANADRFNDKSVMSRDIIDLMVMEANWGRIPKAAWDKANAAYGASAILSYEKAKQKLRDDPAYLSECVRNMQITEKAKNTLCKALGLKQTQCRNLGR